MSRPTILITGCAGYIGTTLCPLLLNSNFNVIGVDDLMYDNGKAMLSFLTHPNFEFHHLDLTQSGERPLLLELLKRSQFVMPLAAIVGAPLCEKMPGAATEVNQKAIEFIVNNLTPEQRIIYPNTNSGYGATDGHHYCTEDEPLNPVSVYGRTKCNAEKKVLNHQNSAVLRLATVFGVSPRMRLDLMVNDFTSKLEWENQEWCVDCPPILRVFEGHAKRNFVHVKDVARAFRWLMNPAFSGVYNLGLPTANLSKLELAHTICDTIGLDRRAVAEGEGRDPDQRNYLVSNEKILKTGFEFKHSLEDGIAEVAKLARLFPRWDKSNHGTMRNV